MYKILIVDDDIGLQSVLSDTVNAEGYSAITAGNGKDALNEFRRHSPDLILLDVKMPGMDGLKVLEKIKDIDKEAIVIMLTGHGDIKDAVRAIKLGALDYITKPFEEGALIANINNALQAFSNKKSAVVISLREKEVLRWIKAGKSSWEIARLLEISKSTVNFHITNIMQKLNASNRTEAIVIAMEQGLISKEHEDD
ncbi:MAG: response regulator transcription factor [Nitrospirae bacterium]|nr:response regulator transcription factor [Nitrospirota bacterium]